MKAIQALLIGTITFSHHSISHAIPRWGHDLRIHRDDENRATEDGVGPPNLNPGLRERLELLIYSRSDTGSLQLRNTFLGNRARRPYFSTLSSSFFRLSGLPTVSFIRSLHPLPA